MGRNTTIDDRNELLGCIPANTPFDECDRVHFKPDFDGDGQAEAYYWDQSTVATQMENMRYGHISAAISSWWGNDSTSDQRLLQFFDWARTNDPGFKLAPYYEYAAVGKAQGDDHEYPDNPLPKTQAPPNAGALALELSVYFDRTWWNPTNHDRVLALDGRPVIFGYHPGYRTCDTVTMWRDALDLLEDGTASVRPFIMLQYWPGGPSCAAAGEADFGFHHYSTGGTFKEAWVDGETQTATIRPGFWRCRLAAPGQGRDPDAWANAVDTLNNAHVLWFQLITSYNEWIEMTAIEPSTDWRIGPLDDPPGSDQHRGGQPR